MLLVFFIVGELLLQQHLCKVIELPRGGEEPNRFPMLVTSPTLHDAFKWDVPVIHWDNLSELSPESLQTSIGAAPYELRNVCIRPNGTIVVVGLSEEEFSRSLNEELALEWNETYNCSWGCNGAAFVSKTPKDALWINGKTRHIIPYLGNVFHHFAERVWPHLTGVPKQYYVHRMHTWLEQAHLNVERNTLMYQLVLLSRVNGASFLQHTENEQRPLCFERLTLCAASSGRMSAKRGLRIITESLSHYRRAAFEYFKISPPEVSLPPRPLRVTLYGRSDATRRRVSNIKEVADSLRGLAHPLLEVTVMDEMAWNGTVPEVVSLMAQTDVYITPHGANTWATVFMPERSAVIEIYGPCGPSTWIGETVVPALKLKHETEGNPWGVRVANARAGNTTECQSALETPDFTIDVQKLREILMLRLRTVDGPGDRLPLHWLFDRETNSY